MAIVTDNTEKSSMEGLNYYNLGDDDHGHCEFNDGIFTELVQNKSITNFKNAIVNTKNIKKSNSGKKFATNMLRSDSEKEVVHTRSTGKSDSDQKVNIKNIKKSKKSVLGDKNSEESDLVSTISKETFFITTTMEAKETLLTVKSEDELLLKENIQHELTAQDTPSNITETQNLNSAEFANSDYLHDLIIECSKLFAREITAGTSSELEKKTKENTKPKNSKQVKFPAYITPKEVEDGLKTGSLIKGIIRINPKNNRKAYISNKDPSQEDYLLEPAEDRNRALEGDIVVIKLKPKEEWKKNKKTAIVVYILERIHSRITVGSLIPFPDNNKQFALLIPRDYRIPKIRIPVGDCPVLFYDSPRKCRNILFKAKITTWNDTRYAVGNILEEIGKVGDLKVETTALIIESGVDIEPYSSELLKDLPIFEGIPSLEIENREDLRKMCVFTIDPDTAHDLDDAVSCKSLKNGNFEVGVHISDVTYYLKEGTTLDKCACKKATTTYLVDKAFHMLPQELCLQCSLLPGVDKLTFSVIWELTETGEIIKQRFVRSVINSCAQLSYEQAESMIEKPNHVVLKDFPQVFGEFTNRDLNKSINLMHKIAVNLRSKRFKNGALRINQEKLVFRLDKETGEPVEFIVCKYQEAHKLVEEFMLLANISVAQKIAEAFPNMAFLRCHSSPNKRLLIHWQKTFKIFDIDIDISSSKALQCSISKLKSERKFGKLTMAAVQHCIIKPMVRAQYICAANTDSKEDFFHYSLHVSMYTHFTSPIRRYADITVHRLLSASLGYTKKHIWKLKYLTTVANNCNKKRDNAKRVQEYSNDLYLAHYIEQHQPFIVEAVVVDIKKESFDILIVGVSVIRIYSNSLGDDTKYESVKGKNKMLKKALLLLPKTSEFPEQTYTLHLFTVLKVSLNRKWKTRRLEAKLVRKEEPQKVLYYS